MAKGLGGGFPIGAMAASAGVMAHFHPGDHASTFGGNPLACAAANAALDVLLEEKLAERAADLGQKALVRMREIQEEHRDKIVDSRGLGLMLGFEMFSEEIAAETFQACLASGILVNRTAGNVIRLVPPLCIEERDLFQALDAIEDSL
jgi:acetylornithine/N-succinyldiaminopimelate aminotransferase